jgi:hypothetical protein
VKCAELTWVEDVHHHVAALPCRIGPALLTPALYDIEFPRRKGD